MGWLTAIASVALTACSFIGPDSDGKAVDAGGNDAPGGGDAGGDAAARELWGTPVRVTSLESLGPASNYDDPSITDAGEMFFAIASNIYSAQRQGSDPTAFDTPVEILELSDPIQPETTIWVERNGLRIMFARAGLLFEATRDDPGDTWTAPAPVGELNTGFTEAMGQLTNGGLTVYFVSNRAGTFDIYRATRPALDQPFAAPELLPLSSDQMTESSVKLTDDELTIYWTQKAPADPTSAFEMAFAERSDTASDFGPPQPLFELNTDGAADSDFTPNPENNKAYFSSDRDNPALPERIFYVER